MLHVAECASISPQGQSIRFSVSPGQSKEGHTGNAWASSAEEGRGTLRKALVSRVQTPTASDVRMGKPSAPEGALSRKGGEPGELKHLNNPRKRQEFCE